jgi:hypothetical protein
MTRATWSGTTASSIETLLDRGREGSRVRAPLDLQLADDWIWPRSTDQERVSAGPGPFAPAADIDGEDPTRLPWLRVALTSRSSS